MATASCHRETLEICAPPFICWTKVVHPHPQRTGSFPQNQTLSKVTFILSLTRNLFDSLQNKPTPFSTRYSIPKSPLHLPDAPYPQPAPLPSPPVPHPFRHPHQPAAVCSITILRPHPTPPHPPADSTLPQTKLTP